MRGRESMELLARWRPDDSAMLVHSILCHAVLADGTTRSGPQSGGLLDSPARKSPPTSFNRVSRNLHARSAPYAALRLVLARRRNSGCWLPGWANSGKSNSQSVGPQAVGGGREARPHLLQTTRRIGR